MLSHTYLRLLAFATVLLFGTTSHLPAATYTWDAEGGTDTRWSTALNWLGNVTPPFAAGDTLDLSTLNITAASTSTVDINATLGAILIGDSTTGSHSWNLAGAGGVLTLDNGASAATITQTATSFGDTISVPLNLKGNLTFTNLSATKALAVIGNISSTATSGTQVVSSSGTAAGTISLGNANSVISDGTSGGKVAVTHAATATMTLNGNNTYTGLTTVGVTASANNLTLLVANSAALGSTAGGTTILGGGAGGTGTRLLLASGVAVVNETLTTNTGSGRTALSYATASGSATWAGNIAVVNGIQLYSETGGGTLVVGTLGIHTVTGTGSISMRGAGTVTINSSINLGANGFGRTDGGSATINSTGNVFTSTSISTGTIVLGANDALPPAVALSLGQASTTTPTFNLNGKSQTIGALTDASNGASGVVTITSTVAGGVLTLNTSTANNYGNTGTGSIIAGTSNLSLVKTGSGSLSLNNKLARVNTYTGATSVNGGTLTLNFANLTTPTNLNDPGSALVLGGGTLAVVGKSGAATFQTVNGLFVNPGASALSVTGTSADAVLALNGITRAANGGTVAFILPTGAQTAANGIVTTSSNVNGILGGWATVGDNFATVSSGNLVANSIYTDVNRLGGTLASDPTSNVRLIEGGVGTEITIATPGLTDIHTLLQSATGGTATLNLASGDIVRFGAGGGILVASTASALTLGVTANTGILTAGGATDTPGGIAFINNSANLISVNTVIADNGSGAVTVTKAGSGPVTLFGSNTYTGGTTVGAGTLTLGSATALGSASATLTVTGGTLNLNGNSLSVGNLTGGGAGTGTIQSGIAGAVTLTIGSGNATGGVYRGAITNGSGTLSLTKIGTGTITLAGTNSFTGGVSIVDGILAISSTTALGTTGTIGFAGGTLQYTSGATNDLSARFSSAAAQNYRVNIGGNGQQVTFASGLNSPDGTLIKTGPGTLILTGASSYTGVTTVSTGLLSVPAFSNAGVAGPLGAASANPANLVFAEGTTLLVTGNSAATDRGLTINGTPTTGMTVYLAAGLANVAINGTVAGAGSLALNGNRDSILTLGGNNTFTGNLTVTMGGVRVTKSDSLGIGPKTVDLTNGTAGNPNLVLDGSAGNVTLASNIAFRTSNSSTVPGTFINLAGDNSILGNITATSGGGSTVATVTAGTLTLGGTISPDTVGRFLILRGAGNGFVTGNIQDGSVAANTFAVQKDFGTGTWTLSGTNTYTLATTVTSGTLLVNGTHTGAGNYVVTGGGVSVTGGLNGTATLGGTGTVTLAGTNTLTASGTATAPGIVAPGGTASVGTLAVNGGNGVVFGANSELRIRLNGPASDTLAVGTNLNLEGTSDSITFTGAADGTTTYTVATYGGTLTGTFETVNALPSGYALDYASTPGSILLAPVPEPMCVLGIGALGLMAWKRRKIAIIH